MKPVRIQRKRTKGFNMQEASPNGLPVVSVCRPGKWGNPFYYEYNKNLKTWCLYRKWYDDPEDDLFVDDYETEEEALYAALQYYGSEWSEEEVEEAKRELGGKNLACFCPLDSDCHADILLTIANS